MKAHPALFEGEGRVEGKGRGGGEVRGGEGKTN